MGIVKAAVISTAMVLLVIFALNRIGFTRNLVQTALAG